MYDETYTPTINITERDVPAVGKLDIDSEGTITLKFRVTGISTYKDEGSEFKLVTMEYVVDDIDEKEVGLREALRKASKKLEKEGKLYVSPTTSPGG